MRRATNVIYFVRQPISNLSHDPAHLPQRLLRGSFRRVNGMDADLPMPSFIKNLYEFEINPLPLKEA
jgi:hypothetical protein